MKLTQQQIEEIKVRLQEFFRNKPVRPDVVLEFIIRELERDYLAK